LGTYQKGTATVSGAASLDVYFVGGNMPSNLYQVFPSPGYDTVTQSEMVPYVDPTSKTQSKFTLRFPAAFTGTVDWLAWL
jgi:hypothetical protein